MQDIELGKWLLIFTIASLYVLFDSFIEKRVKKNILKASNVIVANKARRFLILYRIALAILAIPIICIFGMFYYHLKHIEDFLFLIGLLYCAEIFIFIFIFVTNKGDISFFFGNVSTYDKSSYLSKHNRFAIYLRGFGDDSQYGQFINNACRYAYKLPEFNEYLFVQRLKKYIKLCAVGRPQELDSPSGADRIFLNDNTWKSDVTEFMQKSELIIILVNDRESCIWEILQSYDYLYKTLFIVYDKTTYQSALIKVSGKINLPKSLPSDYCFFYKAKNTNDWNIKEYSNSSFGYKHIARIIAKEILKS